MQNISDSNGFYYIDNVPIVDCYWNVSASKHGYDISWFEMSIDINSTYDFVLTPLGKTLYVGGSGPGNYSKIQDAIDDAGDGDTVFVYNGTYVENVVVNKSIELIGEDKNNTVIYSLGEKGYVTVVRIESDFVTFREFTISLSGEIPKLENPYDGYCECGIYIWSNNSSVSHTIIKSRKMNDVSPYFSGIGIYRCQNNDIYSNFVRLNGQAVSLFHSDNNTVSGNSIFTSYGTYLEDAHNNSFIQNNFFKNLRGWHPLLFVVISSENNTWDKNFWNRPRILPKPILIHHVIPKKEWSFSLNFDWHPAKEPYDIPAGGA